MRLPLFFLIKYSAYNEALIWVAILSAVILTSFFCYLFVHKWNYYDVALPGRCIYKAHISGLCAKGFLLNFIYVLRLSPSPWVCYEKIWTLYHSVGSIWESTIKKNFSKLTRIPTFFWRKLLISFLLKCTALPFSQDEEWSCWDSSISKNILFEIKNWQRYTTSAPI